MDRLTKALAFGLALCILAGCQAAPVPAPQQASPGETGAPVAHAFSEPLLAYAATAQGGDAIDLSGAAMLSVYVDHCEYGEPAQDITDPAIIAAAAEAVSHIAVTGGSDGVSSTGTSYSFHFADAAGKRIASFSFQDGMLVGDDGRYPISGLDELYAVEGIMLADDWDAYWEAEAEKQDDYERSFKLRYPASIFALSGYNASLLEGIDPADIGFISIRVSWNDEAGVLETKDPAVIRPIYEALSAMRAVGKVGEDDPQGQEWSIRFSFRSPVDASAPTAMSAYLSFEGDYLLSDLLDGGTEMPYVLEGLEGLFDCTDADVLQYLKTQRNERPVS